MYKIQKTKQLLKELEKKASKLEISKIGKVGLQTVYDWEKGSEMRFSTALLLCSKLGIDLIELLTTSECKTITDSAMEKKIDQRNKL